LNSGGGKGSVLIGMVCFIGIFSATGGRVCRVAAQPARPVNKRVKTVIPIKYWVCFGIIGFPYLIKGIKNPL
jgi:hypothetical protein